MWIASFMGCDLRIVSFVGCVVSFVGRGFSRDIQHRNKEGLQPLKCSE
jgi:hypothetical protein